MKKSDQKKIFVAVFVAELILIAVIIVSTILPFLFNVVGLSDQKVIKKFNQIYYNSRVWNNTKWLGVASEQNPCDNWAVQEIISDIKPDFLIETGTAEGGSSLFYATILDYVSKNGKVITVDIENKIKKQTAELPVFKKRVKFILGDSVSSEVINAIQKKVKNHKVLVTLDSLHTKDHVLKELKLYSNFVSLGSYIVVQDTNINGHPVAPEFGPGPMEAIEEFLKTDDRFIVDHSREEFLLTFYPSGYLKRVK